MSEGVGQESEELGPSQGSRVTACSLGDQSSPQHPAETKVEWAK